MNFMLITALRVYDRFFSYQFKVECPTGSGQMRTLNEVALDTGHRLFRIFLPDHDGRRPVYRNHQLANDDPAIGEYPMFYEYFHGDCGAGLGPVTRPDGWAS